MLPTMLAYLAFVAAAAVADLAGALLVTTVHQKGLAPLRYFVAGGAGFMLAAAFVRMLPIAPFSVVNVVAGASHIRWSDFLLGTIIGLLPGITTLTFFVDRAIAAIRDPGAGTFALLAVAVAILVALVWVLRRKLRRKAPTPLTPVPNVHGS